jgi:hypothetical protein
MSESTLNATIEVRLPETLPSKFERERRAFFRLLPGLLATHSGQYVAIHDEQVVDSGPDQLEVALRVQRRVGGVAIYVHLVSDEPNPICRSGVVRDVSRQGPRP